MSKQMINAFDCYVDVRGKATDPDDEGLVGVYLVSVTTSAPVNLGKLTAIQEHRIAEAVLDEFHNHQGIEVVDDFAITAYLQDGRDVTENAEAAVEDDNFSVSANYSGSIDMEDLPKALSSLAEDDDDADASLQSSRKTLQVDSRELATILAALRYWQREGLLSGGHEREIATDGDTLTALNASEIDNLYETLNCGDSAEVPALKLYMVSGRVWGDDDDSVYDVWAENESEAQAKFEATLREGSDCDASTEVFVILTLLIGSLDKNGIFRLEESVKPRGITVRP